MKRKLKPKYSKCYPLFKWHKCCMCGLEFRREFGWRFQAGLRGCYYVCTSCAPAEKDIIEIIIQHKYIPSKPPLKASPPPPKKKLKGAC